MYTYRPAARPKRFAWESSGQGSLDRLGEGFGQTFEVGVALPGALSVEAACDLSECETEYRDAAVRRLLIIEADERR